MDANVAQGPVDHWRPPPLPQTSELDYRFRIGPADTEHMALDRIADDPDLDAYIADGLVGLEQLLANHASFDQFVPKRYDPEALDRLIEALWPEDGFTYEPSS